MNAWALAPLLFLLLVGPVCAGDVDQATVENGLREAATKLGADVSGDAVISASFSGMHVDLGKDGGRFRFDLDTSDIGWVNDLNRLDLKFSGPLNLGNDNTESDASGVDAFKRAYAAEVSYTLIKWNVGESRETTEYLDEICQRYRQITGVKGFCNENLVSMAHADRIQVDGFDGTAAEKADLQKRVAEAYVAVWRVLQDAASVYCLRPAVVPVDPRWFALAPPFQASQFEGCLKPATFSALRFSASGGSREVGETLVGDALVDRGTVYPWKISASYVRMLGERLSLAAALSYQRSFGEGTARQLCSDAGGGQSTCRDVHVDAGAQATSGAATLDAGYRLGALYAIKLVGTYDFESGDYSASLPLYLMTLSKDGGLDGGVAFDWDSRSESPLLRFFLGQAFTLAGGS